MKFVGKKTWVLSILFWFVYFIIMMAVTYMISMAIAIPFIGLALSIVIFCALAHYWFKFPWIMALKLFAVAFVIDFLIIMMIVVALGFSITAWIPSMQSLEGMI